MTATDRLAVLATRAAEAATHAPAFARRLAEAGLTPADLARPEGLNRLPILTKDQLMRMQAADPPFAGFLSCPPDQVAHVFASPGPIFEPVLAEDATGMGMSLMFAAAGLGPGDVALNTWSYHLVPAGLLFDRGLRAVGATVIPSGPGQTDLQIGMIAALRVTAFLGSATYFETVAEAWRAAHGATAGHWPLRHAFLVGEPGGWPERRARIEADHGVQVHTAYGTADLGLVGHERRGLPGYDLHPERLVQICDRETGQPLPAGQAGQIVVSTLARGWPMIRFGTGDLALALEIGPDGFVHRLGPIEGRMGAGVKVREIFIYPDHLTRLAADLPGPGREARAAITREGGRDVITVELTGPPVPEPQVAEAFRRITRLGLDRVVATDRFTIAAPLHDARRS